eukprot:jgi/Botrbrau1/21893/Bobra.0249s0022.1
MPDQAPPPRPVVGAYGTPPEGLRSSGPFSGSGPPSRNGALPGVPGPGQLAPSTVLPGPSGAYVTWTLRPSTEAISES